MENNFVTYQSFNDIQLQYNKYGLNDVTKINIPRQMSLGDRFV